MIKLVMLFRYKAFSYVAMFSAAFLLSGCLGGTIAQQIVRSIATRVADKAVARAMDVDEDQAFSNRDPFSINRPQDSTNQIASHQSNALQGAATSNANAKNTKPKEVEVDDFTYAMATSGFQPVTAIAEPLPEQSVETEAHVAIVQGNQLVRVELFNLLIGEEKNAVYESARLMGSASLPQKREWQNWNVGTGQIKSGDAKIANQKDKKIITFLIPPQFGKLPSGALAVVELGSPGELNIARYKAYEETVAFKAATNR
jgi:hypothetical protein